MTIEPKVASEVYTFNSTLKTASELKPTVFDKDITNITDNMSFRIFQSHSQSQTLEITKNVCIGYGRPSVIGRIGLKLNACNVSHRCVVFCTFFTPVVLLESR